MMALTVELIVLILLFTVVCVRNTINVENRLDWAALNYPPAVVNRLIEQGRLQIQKPLPLAERLKKKFPVIIVCVFVLAAVVWFVNGCRTFLSAFGVCMLIWTVVDWYDALILDCLWFCHSKRARISGTEDMTDAYHDYRFHIIGSARGMVLGLLVSLFTGLAVALAALIV